MASTSSNHNDFSNFASTSTSSSHQDWNYHVFVSFRGKDTRNTFTGHLVAALKQTGLRIFIDEDEMPRGEEISPQLRKAIQESRICIVVFSKSYASSKWCLDELVEILECKKHTGNTVYPVFYDVNPSDVRYQRGNFADYFASHEQRLVSKTERQKIKTWRSALSEAADLSGYCLQTDANGYHIRTFIFYLARLSILGRGFVP